MECYILIKVPEMGRPHLTPWQVRREEKGMIRIVRDDPEVRRYYRGSCTQILEQAWYEDCGRVMPQKVVLEDLVVVDIVTKHYAGIPARDGGWHEKPGSITGLKFKFCVLDGRILNQDQAVGYLEQLGIDPADYMEELPVYEKLSMWSLLKVPGRRFRLR
jgi:hypothetical protein